MFEIQENEHLTEELTEIQKMREKLKLQEQEEIKKVKTKYKKQGDKHRKQEKDIKAKIRAARNNKIYAKGSIFERLGLLEVDYYVLLGCLAHAKTKLLHPGSQNYIEWELLGRQTYSDAKNEKEKIKQTEGSHE